MLTAIVLCEFRICRRGLYVFFSLFAIRGKTPSLSPLGPERIRTASYLLTTFSLNQWIVTVVWVSLFYFAHFIIYIINSDYPTASGFKCKPQHCKWPHQHFKKKPILYGWSLSDVGLEFSCDECTSCSLGPLTRSAQKPTHCSGESAWL